MGTVLHTSFASSGSSIPGHACAAAAAWAWASSDSLDLTSSSFFFLSASSSGDGSERWRPTRRQQTVGAALVEDAFFATVSASVRAFLFDLLARAGHLRAAARARRTRTTVSEQLGRGVEVDALPRLVHQRREHALGRQPRGHLDRHEPRRREQLVEDVRGRRSRPRPRPRAALSLVVLGALTRSPRAVTHLLDRVERRAAAAGMWSAPALRRRSMIRKSVAHTDRQRSPRFGSLPNVIG